jgi:hypothetical protein
MRYITVLLLLSIALCGNAQIAAKTKHWQLLDYQQDSVYGASVNRVYKE